MEIVQPAIAFDSAGAAPAAMAGRLLAIDVDAEYAEELAACAARYALEFVEARGRELAQPDGVSLCAIGATGGGAAVCERVRALGKLLRGTPIVVLGAGLDTDSVVRLMRLGVADVIGLPAEPSEVATRILEHLPPRPDEVRQEAFAGRSSAACHVRREIAAIARTHSTVLLTGETGTGKGVVARLVHRCSERRDGPFLHLDCASLSPALIESELFGHERGAFTGATERRAGRFELASDGTVFLDEIGELDLGLQVKLLRVLEDREYERIGGNRTLSMRARVIAATNRDLRRGIDEGRFRADLYFRLNVFRLHLPPLRERVEDVPLLARAALDELGTRLGVRVPRPSSALLAALMAYEWPGNVRELYNVLERMLVRGCGPVLEEDDLDEALPDTPRGAGESFEAWRMVNGCAVADPDEESDRLRVAAALRHTGGNVARAARRLSLARSTLRYRIKRYGLHDLIPRD